MTKIALHGRDELIAALNRLGADVQVGAAEALQGHGKDVAKALRAALPEGGGVSKPGEAPHSQETRAKRSETARKAVPVVDLKGSVHWAMRKAELGKEIVVSVYVRFKGSNGFYGHMLEYGTSKLAARPFFWLTVLKLAPDATKRIEQVIRKATERFNAR